MSIYDPPVKPRKPAPAASPAVSYVRPDGPAPQGKFGSPSAMGFSPAYTPTVQPRPENKGFAAAATTPPKSFFPTKEFWADPTGYGQPLFDNFLSKILPSKERLDNSSFSYLNLLDPKNSFTPSMIPGIIGSAVPGGVPFNLSREAIKSSGYEDTISQYGPLAALGVTAAKMFGNRNDPIAMARNLMPLFQSVVTGNVVGGLNNMTGLDWGPAAPAIYPKANLGFVNPQYPSSANAGSYSQWLTDPRVTQNSPKLLPAPRKEDYLPGESTSYLNWNEKQWLDYQRKEGLTNFDTSFLPTVKPKGAGGGFKGFTHGDWGSIKQIMDQFFTNQDPPPSVGDKNADPDFIKAFEEELFDNPGVNPYILWNNMMKNFVPLQDRPKMGYTDSDGREWISKEAKDNFFEMVKNWKEPEPNSNPSPPPPELWWPGDLPSSLVDPDDGLPVAEDYTKEQWESYKKSLDTYIDPLGNEWDSKDQWDAYQQSMQDYAAGQELGPMQESVEDATNRLAARMAEGGERPVSYYQELLRQSYKTFEDLTNAGTDFNRFPTDVTPNKWIEDNNTFLPSMMGTHHLFNNPKYSSGLGAGTNRNTDFTPWDSKPHPPYYFDEYGNFVENNPLRSMGNELIKSLPMGQLGVSAQIQLRRDIFMGADLDKLPEPTKKAIYESFDMGWHPGLGDDEEDNSRMGDIFESITGFPQPESNVGDGEYDTGNYMVEGYPLMNYINSPESGLPNLGDYLVPTGQDAEGRMTFEGDYYKWEQDFREAWRDNPGLFRDRKLHPEFLPEWANPRYRDNAGE